MSFSVGQVSRLAGITVRTLHHYDEIGLLSPSERTRAGYRRYTDDDLLRLQQVLLYRELGFPLEEIAVILDEPRSDELTHLRRQHELLLIKSERLRDMIAAVERAMEARTMNIELTPEERFEVFGDFRPEDHDAEVERRWGDTREYAESRRRVASYTKADWLQLKAEAAAITEELAAAFKAGLPADGEQAMNLAERHRGHISRWFYTCSYDIHRCLGELYVTDPRFTATFDAVVPGLAAYFRVAIDANADSPGR
ncbi:MerR family transcriptional regulator [Nonomuraea muscovyensis]|uniref:DNA-binding transcriptional MerR regulator n=1 Tax=Nonomuraea muscovyensis TaxID=1124761 RepID=A0A7X0C332_9ACTN|nr:MerR family transcriptional regulator [Nonomuraea muscovyensis]MBB6347577.1 DNA-binding transcriptional MerR regulator [Nonomuraea muscovyensis]